MGTEHLDLVEATLAWWTEATTGSGAPAPASVVAAWRVLYRQCWLAQAEVLLGGNAAVGSRDPRLRRPAATVAAGQVGRRNLEPGGALDGDWLRDEAMAEHETRRAAAVQHPHHPRGVAGPEVDEDPAGAGARSPSSPTIRQLHT